MFTNDLLFLLGSIVRADVMKNDDGRSKGCGTVTFENNTEANRAVGILFSDVTIY